MESAAFDAFLRLEDMNGNQLMEDDDSGGNLNARMFFTPQRSGSYVIVATTYEVNTFGPYALSIRESNGVNPAPPPPVFKGPPGFKKKF